MGGEERDSVLLEVSLVGVEHTVEPLEELVSTVIGVENDGDTVEGSDGSIGEEEGREEVSFFGLSFWKGGSIREDERSPREAAPRFRFE